MTSVYVKLVIAGSREISSVPAKHIVEVAKRVIEKGAEDGETYITIDDVPEKYKEAVIEALKADGYDENGENM